MAQLDDSAADNKEDNPSNSDAIQLLNQLTTKMRELQEKQARVDSQTKELEQNYLELQKKRNSLKQSTQSNSRSGPTTSLYSALGSLVVNNYYYFFYSYSSNTTIIDIIQSSIKKGSCMYNRTESIYTRQARISKLPEGIYPKVQRPLSSFFIKIDFEFREFLVKITEKMTGAQLYSVVRYSLLADEFINEWDSVVLFYNMEHISPKVTLTSINITPYSVIRACRKERENPSQENIRPVVISLEENLQQELFISNLQGQKYANVKHLVLLAGFSLL